MSWIVNPQTLEFETLNEEERRTLLSFCTNIVREGFVNGDHPAYVAWIQAARSEERYSIMMAPASSILIYSTVFVQKALLSVAIAFSKSDRAADDPMKKG